MKYVDICTYLSDLVNTTLRPGDKVPSERALCDQFGVSRMTVRQAIDILVNEGLLVRRQGRGTFVAPTKLDLQLRITSFAQEMRMRGMVPSTKLLETYRDVPPAHIARALALDDGDSTYYIRRLRYADNAPMCIEEAWLPESPLPGFFDPNPPESIYSDLQARGYCPTWGEDTIESINLDRTQAKLLEVEPGAAGIVVTRRTFTESMPIEFAISFYRGDRYKLWVPIAQPLSPIHPPVPRRH